MVAAAERDRQTPDGILKRPSNFKGAKGPRSETLGQAQLRKVKEELKNIEREGEIFDKTKGAIGEHPLQKAGFADQRQL